MNVLKKSLLITGMKHCGKSTVGKMLAGELSCPFSDLDNLAEEIYLSETGERLSSREIFRKGRNVFQNYEYKAAVKAVEPQPDSGCFITAAGGGFCENPKAVEALKPYCSIIYIEESSDILYSRIIRGGIPAFLSKEKPYENFISLYKTRTALYDNISDIKLIADGRSAVEICREISMRLREDGYAR